MILISSFKKKNSALGLCLIVLTVVIQPFRCDPQTDPTLWLPVCHLVVGSILWQPFFWLALPLTAMAGSELSVASYGSRRLGGLLELIKA